jgi:diguanylate cyclase (GGDEF)-like protein
MQSVIGQQVAAGTIASDKGSTSMQLQWLGSGILLCVIVTFHGYAKAVTPPLPALLQHAEQISHIDQQQLDLLLDQLAPHTAHMSVTQQQQYRLLRIEQSILGGQTAFAHQALTDFLEAPQQQPLAIRLRTKLLAARTAMASQQFSAAFGHLYAAMQDYELLNTSTLRAATLLLAVEFYYQAGMLDEARIQQQALNSFAAAGPEQCQAAYIETREFDRSRYAQATPFSSQFITRCQTLKLTRQAMALQSFNHRITLARSRTAPDSAAGEQWQHETQLTTSAASADVETRLLDLAIALHTRRFAVAEQLSTALLALPVTAMSHSQRLDLLQQRLLLLQEQRQFDQLVVLRKKILELTQIHQQRQSMLQLASQSAVHQARQHGQQLKILQEELKSAELTAQLKQQQTQRQHAVIALLILVSLLLSCGLFWLASAHRKYKATAMTDRLTGIGNKHRLDAQLNRLLSRCQLHNKPVGVILFELDQFAGMFCGQGHNEADQALQRVSQICSHFIRHSDLFCYLEGGCFVIVLPDCQPDKVAMLAEICRDAIAETASEQDNVALTASVGVSFSFVSGYSASGLLHHAEQALHLAQRHGQNRVECFDNQPGSGRPLRLSAMRPELTG